MFAPRWKRNQVLENSKWQIVTDSQENTDILNKFFACVSEIECNENLPEFQDRPFVEPLCSLGISDSKLS